MWPAHGGVVIDDGVLYFAASIWPWMGTFIYALDADTPVRLFGEMMIRMPIISCEPHNYTAYAGIAPQGMLVLSGNRLLISGGPFRASLL